MSGSIAVHGYLIISNTPFFPIGEPAGPFQGGVYPKRVRK
jgi:hypothetical protein